MSYLLSNIMLSNLYVLHIHLIFLYYVEMKETLSHYSMCTLPIMYEY